MFNDALNTFSTTIILVSEFLFIYKSTVAQWRGSISDKTTNKQTNKQTIQTATRSPTFSSCDLLSFCQIIIIIIFNCGYVSHSQRLCCLWFAYNTNSWLLQLIIVSDSQRLWPAYVAYDLLITQTADCCSLSSYLIPNAYEQPMLLMICLSHKQPIVAAYHRIWFTAPMTSLCCLWFAYHTNSRLLQLIIVSDSQRLWPAYVAYDLLITQTADCCSLSSYLIHSAYDQPMLLMICLSHKQPIVAAYHRIWFTTPMTSLCCLWFAYHTNSRLLQLIIVSDSQRLWPAYVAYDLLITQTADCCSLSSYLIHNAYDQPMLLMICLSHKQPIVAAYHRIWFTTPMTSLCCLWFAYHTNSRLLQLIIVSDSQRLWPAYVAYDLLITQTADCCSLSSYLIHNAYDQPMLLMICLSHKQPIVAAYHRIWFTAPMTSLCCLWFAYHTNSRLLQLIIVSDSQRLWPAYVA